MLPSLGSATCTDTARKCHRCTQNQGISGDPFHDPFHAAGLRGHHPATTHHSPRRAGGVLSGCRLLSLGYEPYDGRLCRLAWSPVVALTLAYVRSGSTSSRAVSPSAAGIAASGAQIRAHISFLTSGSPAPGDQPVPRIIWLNAAAAGNPRWTARSRPRRASSRASSRAVMISSSDGYLPPCTRRLRIS